MLGQELCIYKNVSRKRKQLTPYELIGLAFCYLLFLMPDLG